MTVRGLWIDDAPQTVLRPAYLKTYRALGFSVAAVMLETSKRGFDPKWTAEDLRKLAVALRDHGIELVLTVWPEPNESYVAEMAEALPAFLEVTGAAAVEFDAESNFTRSRLDGYESLDEASVAISAVLADLRSKFGIRSELTTFTEHGENGPRAVLATQVDVVVPQGYSVANRKDGKGRPFVVPFRGHPYSPGSMQTLTFSRAQQIPRTEGRPAISCGLAAYDQVFAGHTVQEAMRVAYEEALRFSPREVRWWSSKWVVGARAQRSVQTFFHGLLP